MNTTNMNKQDDKQERVTPKLRFPEFQMELGWRKDDLGNLFTERKEKGYPNLPLLSLTEQNGIIPQAETNRKNNSSLDKSKYLRVCYGDIAYNTMRMWEGRSAFVNMEGIVSPAYTICTPKNNINSFFYSYYFKLPNLISEFHRYSQGLVKDTLNLKFDKFAQISVGVPPKSEEQQKIADCLSSIDELINFREQKLAALKQHKKGLMQQLFPSHNDLQASKRAIVYPKLRFPQFKDCKGWEVVKLEELFDLTIQNEKANSFDKDKIITVKLHTLGVVKNERTDTLTGGTNYFHRKAGDFIFSKIDFLNGAFGIVPNELDGFCSSSDIPSFSFKPESNANFFMYWLKANYLDFKIERAGTSNTLKRISSKALFAMQLPIPLPEEQQAIADCLSSLDKLISEENEQIGRLKDHKKGLMQQLFPKIQ